MIYKVNEILEINYKCRGYCVLPYPGHKRGCPNFNNSPDCPLKVDLVKNVFDLNKDLFFVVKEFDLKSHVEKMRIRHPDWTLRQLRNLLYWQGGIRKQLKDETEEFIRKNSNRMIYTLLPEAMGVMVINTALKLGIPIERTPVNKVFKIALVGYKKIEESLH